AVFRLLEGDDQVGRGQVFLARPQRGAQVLLVADAEGREPFDRTGRERAEVVAERRRQAARGRPPGQPGRGGAMVEEDLGEAAAVVVAGANEQDGAGPRGWGIGPAEGRVSHGGPAPWAGRRPPSST